jgi:two-component system response regulator HydG
MAKILIVDDDSTFSQLLENFLQKKRHEPIVKASVKAGLNALKDVPFDLLLLDYRLPDGTGLDLLTETRATNILLPTIMMTSFNDVRTAVRAMHMGVFDYITKPVNPDELILVIDNALSLKKAKSDQVQGVIKGTDQQSKKLDEHIELIAPTDLSVLVQGESGTGKEYVARQIHQKSKRSSKPFIAIDCGALSKDLASSELFGHVKGAFTGAIADKKGVFEQADGGTLFMDEIGNLDYEVQIKLLRALQEKIIVPLGGHKHTAIDVRIIAATNDELVTSVNARLFRLDLYHRINEFKIQLPPLRQRSADMDSFITFFIAEANRDIGRRVSRISDEALEILHNYDWPGNLRELKNVIRRMVLLTPGDEASTESLPDEMFLFVSQIQEKPDSDLKFQNEMNERKLIQKVLADVHNNKSQAAKLLNIDRKTLYSKLEKYGLDNAV